MLPAYEIARDLSTLHALLPPSDAPSNLALERVALLLQDDAPHIPAVLAHVAIGLAAPEADDAEERALLAALQALLTPQPLTLRPHVGQRCPVPAGALVAFRLAGDSYTYTDQSQAIDWGAGAGRSGDGRVAEWALIAEAQA